MILQETMDDKSEILLAEPLYGVICSPVPSEVGPPRCSGWALIFSVPGANFRARRTNFSGKISLQAVMWLQSSSERGHSRKKASKSGVKKVQIRREIHY